MTRLCMALCAMLLMGMIAVPASAQARVRVRPCDILARTTSPCVAAHSTTRSLYAGYVGPLYQVRRPDGRTLDIPARAADGIADAARQDAFCPAGQCIIVRIYDQSPRHNDLTIEGPGGAGRQDSGAVADALPVTVGGQHVYGVLIRPGMGYRDDATRGVATAGQPETMLMVTSALHANDRCCFDYGNVEVNNRDTGNGHMDALNFGFGCGPRRGCLGDGPWVQADLENGLFMSDRGGSAGSPYRGSQTPFVTALLKNDGGTFFALKAGDGQRGPLTLVYHGPEPERPGYSPMHQEGAIVLGTGGDNSNGGSGCFFEGFMTAGVTMPRSDDAVQANIVAAGYRLAL